MKNILWTCLLSLFVGTAASADLLFDLKKPEHQAIIQNQYNQGCPMRLRSLPIMVVELSQKQVAKKCKCGDNIVGMWDGHNIYLSYEGDDAKFIFMHELGHAYWEKTLTREQRQDWIDFWKAHKKDMPREYARKNVYEGFADCFKMVYGTPGPDWKVSKEVSMKVLSYETP
jgi:hypothetical protein